MLSAKAKENLITVVEDFDFEVPKTKKLLEIKENLKIDNKKSLLILADSNKNVYLSSRNLSGFSVLSVSEINTYELIRAKNIILFESSIEVIEKKLKN